MEDLTVEDPSSKFVDCSKRKDYDLPLLEPKTLNHLRDVDISQIRCEEP